MLLVECPKRYADDAGPAGANYDYYAGYSLSFAQNLLAHIPVEADSLVVDPWNGAGTTTAAAAHLGMRSFGSDLNPVMVLVAKARLLRQATLPSVEPLWDHLQRDARQSGTDLSLDREPLRDWFKPNAASAIRHLETAIRQHLVAGEFLGFSSAQGVAQVSDLAAFFYVALFRSLKGLLGTFKTSNPTWTRRAKCEEEKVDFDLAFLLDLVQSELSSDVLRIQDFVRGPEVQKAERHVELSNSESLPLPDHSADIVLSSPPYCTRIDYAVATSVELAVLGFERSTSYAKLRDALMGTTTVPKDAPKTRDTWGSTCLSFLEQIRTHRSVASDTYYWKNHLRYFDSLQKSISEISRILKPDGIACLVVQDSKYKDIHNDLAQMVCEMAAAEGLRFFQRDDYKLGSSLASINQRSRAYNAKGFRPTETVVSFHKFQ